MDLRRISGLTFAAMIFCSVFVARGVAVAQDSLPDKSVPAQKDALKDGQETAKVPVAEMPTLWSSNGVDFWHSNRFNVADALGDARGHYRKGQLRAAQAEVEEAVTWLHIVKSNADAKSKSEIEIVISDLVGVAENLDSKKSVSAKKLNQVFANANLALAKHHFSQANRLSGKADMFNASRRLIAAADYLKNAANAADITPNPIVGTFRDEYSPFGMVDESLELNPTQLKDDLEQLSDALRELSEKMKKKSLQ